MKLSKEEALVKLGSLVLLLKGSNTLLADLQPALDVLFPKQYELETKNEEVTYEKSRFEDRDIRLYTTSTLKLQTERDGECYPMIFEAAADITNQCDTGSPEEAELLHQSNVATTYKGLLGAIELVIEYEEEDKRVILARKQSIVRLGYVVKLLQGSCGLVYDFERTLDALLPDMYTLETVTTEEELPVDSLEPPQVRVSVTTTLQILADYLTGEFEGFTTIVDTYQNVHNPELGEILSQRNLLVTYKSILDKLSSFLETYREKH